MCVAHAGPAAVVHEAEHAFYVRGGDAEVRFLDVAPAEVNVVQINLTEVHPCQVPVGEVKAGKPCRFPDVPIRSRPAPGTHEIEL